MFLIITVILVCNAGPFPQRLINVFFKSLIIYPMQLNYKTVLFHCYKCYKSAILLQEGVFRKAVSRMRDNGLGTLGAIQGDERLA